MDEDLITNPKWSQRRQNRATAFRFIFQWEMNPTDDLNRDLNDFIHRLGKSDDYFSYACLLYTSPSPRDLSTSRMPSSA